MTRRGREHRHGGEQLLTPWHWAEHTGELELELEAPSEEAIFAEGLRALREQLESEPGGEPATVEVQTRAPDRPALLASWLQELLYLAEAEGFVAERVESLALDDGALRARVGGRRARAASPVKAVTYHELRLWRDGPAWRATLVLDV